MAEVRARGLRVEVPGGWECQIRACAEDAAAGRAGHADTAAAAGPGERAVAHVANFALPAQRGDYGGGAVELMGPRHVLLALVEFDRADAQAALFAAGGPPRRLRPRDFHPDALQRAIPGQAGHQRFFHDRGRAFCLYVVLGSARLAALTVAAANDVLAGLRIE